VIRMLFAIISAAMFWGVVVLIIFVAGGISYGQLANLDAHLAFLIIGGIALSIGSLINLCAYLFYGRIELRNVPLTEFIRRYALMRYRGVK
jgi:hypothetical protein